MSVVQGIKDELIGRTIAGAIKKEGRMITKAEVGAIEGTINKGVDYGIKGAIGGAIVGGTANAIDGNDNTTILGGALGGAAAGLVGGAMYGGSRNTANINKETAQQIITNALDGESAIGRKALPQNILGLPEKDIIYGTTSQIRGNGFVMS